MPDGFDQVIAVAARASDCLHRFDSIHKPRGRHGSEIDLQGPNTWQSTCLIIDTVYQHHASSTPELPVTPPSIYQKESKLFPRSPQLPLSILHAPDPAWSSIANVELSFCTTCFVSAA